MVLGNSKMKISDILKEADLGYKIARGAAGALAGVGSLIGLDNVDKAQAALKQADVAKQAPATTTSVRTPTVDRKFTPVGDWVLKPNTRLKVKFNKVDYYKDAGKNVWMVQWGPTSPPTPVSAKDSAALDKKRPGEFQSVEVVSTLPRKGKRNAAV